MSNSVVNTKYRWMTLDSGNTLQITFNEKSKVMCVDLVSKNNSGNEFVRMVVNEKELLEHT